MFGRILTDTAIAGEPVSAGEIVEVDDVTYRQLKRCKRIAPCDPPDGVEPEPPAKPAAKLKRIKPPEKPSAENPA